MDSIAEFKRKYGKKNEKIKNKNDSLYKMEDLFDMFSDSNMFARSKVRSRKNSPKEVKVEIEDLGKIKNELKVSPKASPKVSPKASPKTSPKTSLRKSPKIYKLRPNPLGLHH